MVEMLYKKLEIVINNFVPKITVCKNTFPKTLKKSVFEKKK